jgi:hypothetical protein
MHGFVNDNLFSLCAACSEVKSIPQLQVSRKLYLGKLDACVGLII